MADIFDRISFANDLPWDSRYDILKLTFMAIKKRRPQAKEGMTSTDLRTLIKQLVSVELKDMQALLDECSLEKRAALLARIGTIILPRQTTEEANEESGVGGTLVDRDNGTEPVYNPPQEYEQPKKAGRPLGSLNKKTPETRERLEAIFISEYNYVMNNIEELSPEKHIDLILKLAVLTMPVQIQNDLDEDDDNNTIEEIRYKVR